MNSTLLFIHGAGGSHRVWKYQTEFFSRAIAIDLSGHGSGIGKRTIDEYVAEVKKFCDEKGLKNIVMVGHSMGGAIVQKFALEHPAYLKAIVLVCTGARLRVAPVVFEAIKTDYARAVELMTALVFSSKTASQIKTKAAEQMMEIEPEVTYGDFEACDRFDIMDKIEQIRLPTLIVCGKEDQLTPVKYSEYFRNKILNSKLEIIAGAGHMVMLEKPKEFNEKLEKFVRELNS